MDSGITTRISDCELAARRHEWRAELWLAAGRPDYAARSLRKAEGWWARADALRPTEGPPTWTEYVMSRVADYWARRWEEQLLAVLMGPG